MHTKEDNRTVDVTWSISKSNEMLQLTTLIPIDLPYQDNHAARVEGSVWLDHNI